MLEFNQIESFYPESLRPFKRNLLREYLQYKILEFIFSSDLGVNLVFMGGTAIHIIHGMPRFSEDLDFDNIGLDKKDFRRLADFIEKKLRLEGYDIEVKTSFSGAYRVYVRFSGILHENRISPHKGEKMLIQIDSEPQNYPYAPIRP